MRGAVRAVFDLRRGLVRSCNARRCGAPHRNTRGRLSSQGRPVVFLGDSITERAMYTGYIENWVRALHPELEVRFLNAGKGSDTAEGGLRRLRRMSSSIRPRWWSCATG